MYNKFNFSSFDNSPEALANVFLKEYFNKELSFPIDPFMILKDLGVIYQFRDFEELEGIYLLFEASVDIPIVGINLNRRVTRQRFTAAHELCHHIKDKRENAYCPIDVDYKNEKEKFADRFAAELLMPEEKLKRVSDNYLENGYICFDNIIKIANYFGVSFSSRRKWACCSRYYELVI